MNTWERPEPKDLLRVIKNHKLRYVNSGFDLMNVLKESLERAELRLQGKNPLSFLLWDEISTKVVNHSCYNGKLVMQTTAV